MNRQAFVRVLLSLLLLMSQQMAMSHALSHWTASIDGVQQVQLDEEGSLSTALAKDQSCNQCLAFAQLATPVASAACTFVALDADPTYIASSTASALCARTVCVFQPRGPPQA
jgi:hypothetical protein